jgi:pyruvate ferredoxin oxidoreductase beta subunit
MRPFPDEEFRLIAKGVKSIGVVDRMMLHGTRGGGAFQDLKGALYATEMKVPIKGFVTGMGGEDIPIEDMYMMGKKTLQVAKTRRLDKEVEFIEHKSQMIANPVEIEQTESIFPGSDGCAGCGASIIVRRVLNILGKNTVVINPPSCSGVNYSTVVKIPWILANFAAGAAYETGVFRALRKKGKADKVYVTSFAGDGGTADIGLQSLSGAAERGESFIWLCYDNEAYMNTGIQRSGSTPLFSATSTTPVGKVWSGKQMRRKNLEMIMAAHRIPYIATGSLSYLPDLERKIRKAAEITRAGKGLAFLHIQQPCATGWYFPESKTVEVGKLAVQTGAWPLMEIEGGNFKLNFKPKELRPIAEYLKPQQRFRHLNDEQIELLQKDATAEWNMLLEMEKRGRFPGY